MKHLGAFFLIISIFNLAFCRPTIEQVINHISPQILQNGVDKGVLSAGPYFLHRILKTLTPSDNLYSLNLHIRGLNNQTRVDLKATVDNEFNIKSWYYNYSIIKGTRSLGEGVVFAWLDYAASPKSEFCSNLGSYDDAKYLTDDYGRPVPSYLPNNNLNVKSSLKEAYDFGMKQYGDFLLPADENWEEAKSMYITIRFEPDYYVLACGFFQNSYGDNERTLQIWNIYQPCSGIIYSYELTWDSASD